MGRPGWYCPLSGTWDGRPRDRCKATPSSVFPSWCWALDRAQQTHTERHTDRHTESLTLTRLHVARGSRTPLPSLGYSLCPWRDPKEAPELAGDGKGEGLLCLCLSSLRRCIFLMSYVNLCWLESESYGLQLPPSSGAGCPWGQPDLVLPMGKLSGCYGGCHPPAQLSQSWCYY